MRFVRRFSVLLLALSLLPSCGQKSANLQEGAVLPDKLLFENGMKFLGKNQFIKTRIAFQTLINTYPDSEYTPIAFLSIADSYYEEAGTENLLQAEAQYEDFIIFYPTHEMSDDAQMKIAAINVRLMRGPNRDPTHVIRAQQELEKLLDDYPESELSPTASEILREVEETRATGIKSVGDFYFKKGSYLGSESRYKEVIEEYPNFSSLDESLYRLGSSLEKLGRIEEASVYYSRLVAEFPFSDYSENSKERLILLERRIPPVDAAAAERNASNQRVEKGFSILAPIRRVYRVFAGREDPYEIAKRRAEQRRAREQQTSSSELPSRDEVESRQLSP